MTSLQTNPIYKPIVDKLDAIALKELQELDKSLLWSRQFQKHDFKQGFIYPLVLFAVGVFLVLNFGVKRRVFHQYIKYDRQLDFAQSLDIDLDDISNYPPSVLELYREKKKYDSFIKRKEDKIQTVDDQFHDYLEKRAVDVKQRRTKKGLKVKARKPSPVASLPDFKDLAVPS